MEWCASSKASPALNFVKTKPWGNAPFSIQVFTVLFLFLSESSLDLVLQLFRLPSEKVQSTQIDKVIVAIAVYTA